MVPPGEPEVLVICSQSRLWQARSGEATEAGTEPGCSPDTGDRRSWGGRAHARCVATAETAIYGAGRPTPQERRPAAAGPTDAPGSHDNRRPEAQPRALAIGRARSGHGGRTRQPTQYLSQC